MRNRNGKAGVYLLFLMTGLILGGIGGTEIVKALSKRFPSRFSGAAAQLQGPGSEKETQFAGAEASSLGADRENSIVKATKMVSPGVVGIVVTEMQLVRRTYGSDEFFDFFFGPELMPRVKEVERMGSGFIFCKEGYILTNFHVVEGAHKLFVTFFDGSQVEGKVIGVDPQTDLAVISAKGPSDFCVRLGNSDTLLIGEWAIAIGNPFGFFINDAHPTVTVGVISAVDRNFAPSEGVYYQGMIQTDAAINQGNSGGPLVDSKGEVIGINTFIFTGSDSYRGSIGIGFAIPIDRAKRVAREIITFGKRRPIYTGLSVQDLNRSIALALGYDRADGVVISEIAKGSPGEASGLKRGDVILQMGNRRIHSSGDIEGFFLDYFVGDSVNMRYFRKGKSQWVRIILSAYHGVR
jgi:serine protease Do